MNRYADTRLRKFHPWIFSNELADPKRFSRLEPGSLVEVVDCHGDYVGTGFVNTKSLISIRILTRQRGMSVNQMFFENRIESALAKREILYGKDSFAESTYRAVFGEADGLPGLILDRFQGGWVLEPHALGMALRKDEIVRALQSVAARLFGETANIYYRTDHRVAALEGITPEAQLVSGSDQTLFAVEDGIHFPIDPLKGQKTGFFFDQRDNRSFFRDWVKGSSKGSIVVLDLFCHLGAWGLRALKAGASKVVFVDSSATALEAVKQAATEMGAEKRIELLQGDALEIIRSLEKSSFHAVSLDPPALIPNKKSVPQGSKHYFELNRATMAVVASGGLLSSSSCSYHLLEDRFEEIVRKAMVESGRVGNVLRRGGLAADHPFLPGMLEGRYLKNLSLAI